MNGHSVDWNDWRAFLAVARNGSTLSAGRELRVSQTTVARRVAALEQALGLALFERRSAGYALTGAGTALVPAAEAVEQATGSAEEQARAQARDLSGTVRLTTQDLYAQQLVSPLLGALRERFPAIRIELETSSRLLDLGGGEADIGLREIRAETRQPAGVVGRVVCPDEWTLYCSQAYAGRHGVPSRITELREHTILGGGCDDVEAMYDAWLARVGLLDRVGMRFGSSTAMLSAIRSSLGIAVLPCIVGDSDPELIRCVPPLDYGSKLWLVTHERVRRSPAVRAVIDFLYERLLAHVRSLEARDAA
ncbi:LysR family transcriptional regulator [Sphingomonas ginkgonis]|uniref:LysR family transcriptional regulator n=2 Tax=Sphingomonas ginkgonis TaxID=2315330 RepID=A0A3R9YPA8_9SPHN|nr:LysR family transcriptional regulator [Sphingomonas ginkgonis]